MIELFPGEKLEFKSNNYYQMLLISSQQQPMKPSCCSILATIHMMTTSDKKVGLSDSILLSFHYFGQYLQEIRHVGHELRTPLNGILGYTELLKEQVSGKINPSQQDALNNIKLGGFKLGFWFAQQGSIYVFVILIFVYVRLMNKLDKKYGYDVD